VALLNAKPALLLPLTGNEGIDLGETSCVCLHSDNPNVQSPFNGAQTLRLANHGQ
jgi:hypothetical protein